MRSQPGPEFPNGRSLERFPAGYSESELQRLDDNMEHICIARVIQIVCLLVVPDRLANRRSLQHKTTIVHLRSPLGPATVSSDMGGSLGR